MDVVETGIDVLAPVVEHLILAKGDRRLVVHPEAHCLSFLAVELVISLILVQCFSIDQNPNYDLLRS